MCASTCSRPSSRLRVSRRTWPRRSSAIYTDTPHYFNKPAFNLRKYACVADWHTGTWFAVRSEDDEVVLARRGARQGCRLGAICFNLGYELGLGRARERFLREGIALQLTTPNTLAVPWSTVLDSNAALHDVTSTPNDAEYVDDSVFAFQQQISGKPEDVLNQLDRATDILVDEFHKIGLTINFGPGKSAAMVKLYGAGARTLRRSRLLHEGKEQFTTTNGHVLQVVHHFQHLGTVLQDTGGHQEDGRRKASKAQKAFAPLAVPIFGSSHIQTKTKLMLAQSLVLSRSLYAVAAWRGKPDKGWLPIEAQYHKVLRRINGTMRYGAPETIPDAEVREALNAPSLHSLVRARRLAGLCSQLAAPSLVLRCLSRSRSPRLLRSSCGTCAACASFIQTASRTSGTRSFSQVPGLNSSRHSRACGAAFAMSSVAVLTPRK